MTTDQQKSLHIYIIHTRESPKASWGAGRTQFSSLQRLLLRAQESSQDRVATSGGCGRCSRPAAGGARPQLPLGKGCSSLCTPSWLLQLIFTSRSGELDYSDTVKLYLLVLELCSSEIEKSCSQPQTHQKSHSHLQQLCKDCSPTIQT